MELQAKPQSSREGRKSTSTRRTLRERLLVVSAADKEALAARLEQVVTHLRAPGDALVDVAFTLARGRRAMTQRACIVLPEAGEIPDVADLAVVRGRSPKGDAAVAFMFPGQGAQFVGMGRALYKSSQRYRDTFDRCEAILESKLGFRLRELLLAEPDATDPSLDERLTRTSVAQPALFVVEYALADLLMSYGVRPSVLIGHSIGEFAAACLAGVFDLEAALELVCERGRLMGSLPPGSMLAVRCEPAELRDLLTQSVGLAAHNAPGLSVVSGPTADIEVFQKAAEARGLEVRALHTSHAFHSAMMEPILGEFLAVVERARPRAPRIPIVSTMTGARLSDAEAMSPEYWAKQLRNPVRFAEAATCASDDPARVFLEVGPGVSLVTSVGKLTDTPERPRKSIETLGHPKTDAPATDALLTALGQLWIAGATIDWDAFYGASECKLVRLPTYPYRRKRHFIEPPRPHTAAQEAVAHPEQHEADATGSVREDPALGRLGKLLEARLGRALSEDDFELKFLELGLDSLALSQLAGKLRQEFGVQVPVRLLFDKLGTVQLLAEHLALETPQVRLPPATARSGFSRSGQVPLPEEREPSVPPAKNAVTERPLGDPEQRVFDARLSRIEGLLEALVRSGVAPASGAGAGADEGLLQSSSLAAADLLGSKRVVFQDGSTELTASQREIWVAARIGGTEANLAYNECRAFLFDGALDEAALLDSLADVWARHSALRQTFSEDGGRCLTKTGGGIPLERHDLREVAEEERSKKARSLMTAEVSEPFDLARGPLIRGRLIVSSDTEWILVLCAHHVVVDGSSWEILIRELAELYSARRENRRPRLPQAQSFEEYLDLEREYRASGKAAEAEAFWVRALEGQNDDLNLPTDRAQPSRRSYKSTRIDQQLSPELTKKIREVAAKSAVTAQSFLMAAFEILLHRLSRQEDFVCGVPTSGQAAVGMDSLVGHFVHVLPLRCHVDPVGSVRHHIATTQKRMLDGLEYQQATFTEVLPKLNRARDPSRPALVQVAFGMGRSQKRPQFAGLNTALRVVPRVSETFELYVYATDNLGGLEVSWSYNKDLFDAATIELWQRCFSTLVTEMVEGNLDTKVSAIPLLAERDQNWLTETAWGPVIERQRHVPVHRAFAERAEQDPDRTAVIDQNGPYSYRELDQRANRIAHLLRARGVGSSAPGERTLVAVCLDRSVELLAALIGVWRAGAGYVPLDPAYPTSRIHMILEDSRSTLVLTTRSLRSQIPDEYEAVCLDEIAAELAGQPTSAPALDPSPDATAYVIFTSGSTGRPKGVEISQGAFENFTFSMQREPGFTRDDCILALTTISFDISGLELFLPLVTGGRSVVVSKEQAVDPRQLQRLLVEHGVTVMQATPATWQMLFDSAWPGDPRLKVLCGGEAFPRHLAEKFLRTCGEVWNVYGPTETTVWSTVKRVTDAADITIGRPIDNTTLYVLDENRKLVPPGTHGELWIGGDGVALGYLGRADLTAERFAPSPFEPEQRIYRTGDLARVKWNREFECLGRIDFQVKIRGFRIELGEVETAILANAAVRACVVVPHEGKPGEKILVGYVVPEVGRSVDIEELRAQLGGRLPAYMVPSAYVVLDALPMTPNKKVDRKALPAPAIDAKAKVEASKPADEIEARVLAIWKDILGSETLGTKDNFYSAGGHSLMAIRLIERINSKLGTELPVNELFTHPTVEGLSNVLRAQGALLQGPSSERRSTRLPHPAPSGSHKGLFRIQEGKPGGVPLFLIHGDKANGLLLPELGPDLEIWGYHHQGSDGERIQFPTVESLARHALDEWTRQHEDRPCVVAGHSFGALVAYHIGVLRAELALDTPRVVIIDARHPSILGGRGSGLGPRGIKARYEGVRARQKAEHSIERALEYLDAAEVVPIQLRQDYILATYHLAARRYEPPAWSGNLDIIRSKDWTRWAPRDNWEQSAVGKVQRIVVYGSHLSIVRTPEGIAPIGKWLRQVFEELDADPTYRRQA